METNLTLHFLNSHGLWRRVHLSWNYHNASKYYMYCCWTDEQSRARLVDRALRKRHWKDLLSSESATRAVRGMRWAWTLVSRDRDGSKTHNGRKTFPAPENFPPWLPTGARYAVRGAPSTWPYTYGLVSTFCPRRHVAGRQYSARTRDPAVLAAEVVQTCMTHWMVPCMSTMHHPYQAAPAPCARA